jgi:FlaA1/EpsC-like NDP-sugar epimerase
MRRYFMLIPEAVQLVLQAAAIAQPNATYILEMGEQLSVLDMARNLIRLTGFRAGGEMEIRIIGLRPGEKLYEELTGPDETVEPSDVPNVLRVRSDGSLFPRELASLLRTVEAAALCGDVAETRRLLHELVHNYQEPESQREAAFGASVRPELRTYQVV